jgi:hypothetical protein
VVVELVMSGVDEEVSRSEIAHTCYVIEQKV